MKIDTCASWSHVQVFLWSMNLEEGTAAGIFIFISQNLAHESELQHSLIHTKSQ